MMPLTSDASLDGAVLMAIRKYACDTAYSEPDRMPLVHVDKWYSEVERSRSPQEFFRDCVSAVLAHNHDGRIVVASLGAEMLFGYSVDELKGMYSIQIVPEHRKGERKGIIAQAMSGNLVVADTERYRRMSGRGEFPNVQDGTRLIKVRVHVFPYEHNGECSIAAVVKEVSGSQVQALAAAQKG
ncbi:PAS domain S-box protein [Candidatus Woesearchaeota archaeon]|nr:PAS domain S-box protein [Candidatus Woesearchaeota archaeon]